MKMQGNGRPRATQPHSKKTHPSPHNTKGRFRPRESQVLSMYYGLLAFTVCLFGAAFAANQQYQQRMGSGFFVAFLFSALSACGGTLILLPFNGFRLEFTPFTLIMALVNTTVSISYTFCGLKALGKINLSMYSMFAMLGGMLIPGLAGVLFYDETMTVWKAICYVIITAALLIPVEWKGRQGGHLFYIGVFVLNGISALLAKIYQAAPYEKASASGYSLLAAICTLIIAGALAAILYPKSGKKLKLLPGAAGLAHGMLNRVANWLLVITLVGIPASVQFPIVTGGVMVVSTIVSCFSAKKPTKKQFIALGVSLLGIILIALIPN